MLSDLRYRLRALYRRDTVELRPGMASLRVVVVDENSGRMGSVTIPSGAMKATP